MPWRTASSARSVATQVEATSPQGRFAADADRLNGRIFERAQAVGQASLRGDRRRHPARAPRPHRHVSRETSRRRPALTPVGAVRLRLWAPDHVADLRGPMICSLSTGRGSAEIVATLGPDPLRPWRTARAGWAASPPEPAHRGRAAHGPVRRGRRRERLPLRGAAPPRVDPLTRGVDVSDERLAGDLGRPRPPHAPRAAFSQIITMPDQVEEAARAMVAVGRPRDHRRLTGERLGDHFERRFPRLQAQRATVSNRCDETVWRSETLAGRRLFWCRRCQSAKH